MIKDTIDNDIKEAMKAKDSVRLNTVRAIKAALHKAELDNPNGYNETTEAKEIKKLIASHKDSIEQFAGRQDLIDKETAELKIIQEYAPEEIDPEAVKSFVEGYIAGYKQEKGKVSMKDMKYLLGEIQKMIPTIDGKLVSNILKQFI